MANYYDDRAELLGRYIAATGATVRQAAKKFRMAKSTVHKDVTVRLAAIDPALANAVREVLEKNLAERHLRGGEATKLKYLRSAPVPSAPAAQCKIQNAECKISDK